MGIPTEQFVDHEKIPRQFFCAICTDVVLDPVVTCYGHLFCRDEITSWLDKASKCPMTQQPLNKGQLRSPDGMVIKILSDFDMYCSNRRCGCDWRGTQAHLGSHLETCVEKLCATQDTALQERDGEIAALRAELARAKGGTVDSLKAALSAVAYMLALFMKLLALVWLVESLTLFLPLMLTSYMVCLCRALQVGYVLLHI